MPKTHENAVQSQDSAYDRALAAFPPSDRILSTILLRQAEKYGDRILFTFGDTRWTFAETPVVAAGWAQRLAEAGIVAGERVAIHCNNRPEFMQIYLGCAWLGAIATPINTAFRGAQLEGVMNNSTARILVIEEDNLDVLDGLEKGTAVPPQIWTIRKDGIHGPDDALITAPETVADMTPPPVKVSDTAVILYTSGTTGPSKGVCCPQAQMFWWGVYSAEALGVREGDVLMTMLPVFHTNALNCFYQALINGCEYVLEPKFTASGFWRICKERKATVTYLLGAMAAILMAQPERPEEKSHSIRVALGGGVPGPLHAPFRERFNVPLVDGYASTETNFVFWSRIPSDRPGGMGYLSSGAEAIIVDEFDSEVPDGEAGELLLRPTQPYSFATGYFGMPDKTVEAWRNFWFHSGDRVLREPDGSFKFIDRMKDAIRRRGENISSWEVEQELHKHPAVDTCAVFPLPSELGEDEVAVAVKIKAGKELAPEELVAYAQTRLAKFAVPRFIRFVDEMPHTENGKIKKTVFRDQGLVEGIWDREKADKV
ncbi:ATP-dependent acyl-CoA ligase [Martelella sp. FOR1707]